MNVEELKAELKVLVKSLREQQRNGGCGTMCKAEIADEIQRIIDRAESGK